MASKKDAKNARVDPTPSQKKRLLIANARRCCVCKKRGIGFNFHHIDGNSSNTIDENLAVLCVEDHDRHHRPGAYSSSHLDLVPDEIRMRKRSWEAFVRNARQSSPEVVATVSAYGSPELIHSIQLVMQWPDEKIEYVRSFHLLDGNMDLMTDEVIEEVTSLGGKGFKIALICEPLPVEHCPCCRAGLSRTLKPAAVIQMTDPRWATESSCSIYINPHQPSLAICFFLAETNILSGSLHLCRGRVLHYQSDGVDERVAVQSRGSVRTQATRIVDQVLNSWRPAKVLISTGDHDRPNLIDDLRLPKCWEQISGQKRRMRR